MAYGAILGQTVDAFTKAQTYSSGTQALYPSGTDTPDDVLALLSKAALYKTIVPTAQIGTLSVGTIIYLNENGSPIPYIIVNQGIPQNSPLYDSSCDGTWVLRQDIYKNTVWDSDNSNVLPGADIFTTLNEMLPLYDSEVQSAIKTVKIPYCVGGGSPTVNSGTNGLQCQIFLLGSYELGWTTTTSTVIPEDGRALQYFSSNQNDKRIAKLNNINTIWWTRSPNVNGAAVCQCVNTDGSFYTRNANNSYGCRPAFILPSTFLAQTTLPTSGLYDVSGNLLLKLPGVQITTGSYVGTETSRTISVSFNSPITAFIICALDKVEVGGAIRDWSIGIYLRGSKKMASLEPIGIRDLNVSISGDGKTISWSGSSNYSSLSSTFNANGTYLYMAIHG